MTSISTRSGCACLLLANASSALPAVEALSPHFISMSVRNWRSVAESSTTSMFLIGMGSAFPWLSGGESGPGHVPVDVLEHGRDQSFARERLGQVAVGTGEPAARAIEYPVLAGKHDDG